MSLDHVDRTRGRIIAALQEEAEDGWIIIDNELFEIFRRMYEKTNDPIYKPGGSERVKMLIGSINNLRAEGLLEERAGGKTRITGFRLCLESPDAVGPDHAEALEELAGEIIDP